MALVGKIFRVSTEPVPSQNNSSKAGGSSLNGGGITMRWEPPPAKLKRCMALGRQRRSLNGKCTMPIQHYNVEVPRQNLNYVLSAILTAAIQTLFVAL